MKIYKEKGEITVPCWIGGSVSYEDKYYNGYFLHEGFKYVFIMNVKGGRTIENITEYSSGGGAVCSAEVEGKTHDAFIDKFLKKVKSAKNAGRDMNKVVEEYKKRLANAPVISNSTVEPIIQQNENPIELWTISLLL